MSSSALNNNQNLYRWGSADELMSCLAARKSQSKIESSNERSLVYNRLLGPLFGNHLIPSDRLYLYTYMALRTSDALKGADSHEVVDARIKDLMRSLMACQKGFATTGSGPIDEDLIKNASFTTGA